MASQTDHNSVDRIRLIVTHKAAQRLRAVSKKLQSGGLWRRSPAATQKSAAPAPHLPGGEADVIKNNEMLDEIVRSNDAIALF